VLNGAQFHSPFTMFKSQDGKMELNGSDKSPVFVNTNENRNTALLRKFTTFLMDKGKPEDIEKIANYIGPFVGDFLGNGSFLKAIQQAKGSNFINLIRIAKEIIQFSISENVTLKDWRGLIQTLSLKDTAKDNTESRDNQQVVNNEKTVENVIEFPTLESQDSLKSKKIITEQRDPYEKKYMFKSHKPEAETINQVISIEQPQWDVECER